MDEKQIWSLIEKFQNFVDVTDHSFPKVKEGDINIKAIPTTLRFQSTVNVLTTRTSIPRMQDFIRTFSSYENRHYLAQSGLDSQRWLHSQVRQVASGYIGNLIVIEFTHSWAQSSIIARIVGSDASLRDEVVIIGAHQDSINTRGASLPAPGADDNASGSVVVLETLRVLVESGYVPKRTIEFHWYAAEEVGLRGSAAIAASYRSSNVNFVAMVNFDVPGYYVQGTNEIGIYTDNTNAALNTFLRLLTDAYLTFGWRNRTCGYGCSDHASWNSAGYPAGFPAEIVFHPQMHSIDDSFGSVGFTQVNEFVKLALGFMVEMSEPGNP